MTRVSHNVDMEGDLILSLAQVVVLSSRVIQFYSQV